MCYIVHHLESTAASGLAMAQAQRCLWGADVKPEHESESSVVMRPTKANQSRRRLRAPSLPVPATPTQAQAGRGRQPRQPLRHRSSGPTSLRPRQCGMAAILTAPVRSRAASLPFLLASTCATDAVCCLVAARVGSSTIHVSPGSLRLQWSAELQSRTSSATPHLGLNQAVSVHPSGHRPAAEHAVDVPLRPGGPWHPRVVAPAPGQRRAAAAPRPRGRRAAGSPGGSQRHGGAAPALRGPRRAPGLRVTAVTP